MVTAMIKYLLSLSVILALVGCGDHVVLEKTGPAAFTVDHLSIQIYSNGKPDHEQLLYLTLYKVGGFDFHLKKTDLDGDDTKIRTPAFQATFSELSAVTEHWLQHGHTYEVPGKDQNDLPLVVFDSSHIGGAGRSIRLPVSQANAEKLQATLEAAMKPYLK